MILGYNINGFAHHRLSDAVEIVGGLGYAGVAVTPDVHHLDPFGPRLADQTAALRHQLGDRRMTAVVETGARFLLHPLRKHQPTLIGPTPAERRRRSEFLYRAVEIADGLDARLVSFWSGTPTTDEPPATLMARLADECRRLADEAAHQNVRLAFEPEPGMFIDTMDKFAELHAKVDHPAFGLTLDIGHLVCLGELPVSGHVARWKDWLWNVHIEDMKAGIHDHRMFGEGDVDFADVFAGLKAIDYRGMVSVELSRHSYDAVNVARRSLEFLRRFV